jgi:hypothetical protein
VTEITFEKNEYFMGELAKIKIVCDNTKCDKEVKGFKFKLHRNYRAYNRPGSYFAAVKNAYYLEQIKVKGCPAHTKVERELEIYIPSTRSKTAKPGVSRPKGGAIQSRKVDGRGTIQHSDDTFLLEMLPPSFSGTLVDIADHLYCYVKHDSWQEFGEGNCVKLPIRITQPIEDLQTNVEVTAPPNWNP